LTAWQRAFAATNHVVTEGRDQGTLVFPDAFCKFYLTATDTERARRRFDEYRARGPDVSFEDVLRDQRERDTRDAARAIAPMKPADDAVVIDASDLSIEAVVDRMVREIDERQARAGSPVGASRGTSS
jgi:cytidylate kinase